MICSLGAFGQDPSGTRVAPALFYNISNLKPIRAEERGF